MLHVRQFVVSVTVAVAVAVALVLVVVILEVAPGQLSCRMIIRQQLNNVQ